MARYTIRRDDGMYPISADTIAELRKRRAEMNWRFINHGYGIIAYDNKLHKEVDIRTAID